MSKLTEARTKGQRIFCLEYVWATRAVQNPRARIRLQQCYTPSESRSFLHRSCNDSASGCTVTAGFRSSWFRVIQKYLLNHQRIPNCIVCDAVVKLSGSVSGLFWEWVKFMVCLWHAAWACKDSLFLSSTTSREDTTVNQNKYHQNQ